MNLFKTSFWSAVSTIFKMLAGIITTKIMAVYVGPAGIALLGNFNNITNIFTTFANGAIGSGITKYISEFDSQEEKENVVSHAVRISLFFSFLIGVFVIVFHNELAKLAFGDTNYSSSFIIFGLTVVFFGLNTTITSVLNGYRQIKYMILTGIIGSIISVILAIIITIKYGMAGALINSAIAQICIFIVNVAFIKKLNLFKLNMLHKVIDRRLLLKFLKYATMTLASILLVPTSNLMLRNYIINNFSANEAGYIQGLWGISAAYLSVFTTTLSIYYLPTLSSLKKNCELQKEIKKGYKFILPLVIISGIGVYLFRDLIIQILYTSKFSPMRDYFLFQIIGDVLKLASWTLSFLMVAKAMTRVYIITEIAITLIYVTSAFIFMHYFGSVGVTYAYVLEYSLYLILMIIIFRNILFNTEE